MQTVPLMIVLACLGAEDTRPSRTARSGQEPHPAIQVLQHCDATSVESAQRAFRSLAAASPETLPAILAAMDSRPLPAVNWLRCAGDEILDRALARKESIPFDRLVASARDRKLSSVPRRLALEWCERVRPEFSDGFLRGALDDPVFASDAVDVLTRLAARKQSAGDTAATRMLLREAFAAVTDTDQAWRMAKQLQELGDSVDVHRHLGTLTRWRVIGPFPGRDQAGATTVYPPERETDFSKRYSGKIGEVTWRPAALGVGEQFLDLKKLVADTDDAVAYLAATVQCDRQRVVELRGAADDNLQVWVNGSKVISSVVYYQRARHDRHRAKVTLQPGRNLILAKVCEVKLPPGPHLGGPIRWQCSLRVVDELGHGVTFPASD